MIPQRLALMVTVLVLFGLLSGPLATGAQKPDGPLADSIAHHAAARAALRALAVAPELRPRLLRPNGTIKVVVELETPTVVEAVVAAEDHGLASSAASAAGKAQHTRILRDQGALLQQLQALDHQLQVIYATQRVLNGIAIRVDAGQLATIAGLPGVRAVHPLVPEVLDHTSSVPLIGAPAIWQGVNGAAGAGIRIGIIDTGIDYHHVNFGGPGDGYERNDPTVISDGFDAYFGPNAVKVRGGYDFAGDDYDAGNPANDTPRPDPDPLDCNGHGTHVAGSAAGFGTTTARTTFAGPYTDTIAFENLYIGPGTAPLAELYALRVFGCRGSTDLTAQALEWAVDPNGDGDTSDRLDVVNMSLGSDFGELNSATIIATDNAARAGVIVVAAAGNAGDTHYITGSPGVASYAISVASSRDRQSIQDAFRIDGPAGLAGLRPADFSAAFGWASANDVSGDLVYISGENTGCSPFSPAAATQISGRIVLLDWTEPSCGGSVARTGNATDAGAIGVIIADTAGRFDLSITGSNRVPSVSTPFAVGQELKAALAGGPVSLTFSNRFAAAVALDTPEDVDTASAFTSRGPRSSDSVLKPDIAAPGDTIFSAANRTGSAGVSFNGTSMATPHIAGVMALLRELYPERSVSELKAMVMNTAVNDLSGTGNGQPPFHTPQRVGTGRVDVPRAAASQVIVYNSDRPELVSLSFGALELQVPTVLTRTLTVRNLGARPESYVTSFVPGSTVPGVSYRVSPPIVNVPAGDTATINVTLEADPALMRHMADPLLAATQDGLPRHYLAEAAGVVTLASALPASFRALLGGNNVVPPVATAQGGVASFSYDPGANQLSFSIRFSQEITIAESGARLQRGPAGQNGPAAMTLLAGGAYNADTDYPGTVTLSDADEALLYSGGLYVSIPTAAFPSGAIRGQVVPATTPDLRVATYATARPAAAMAATPDLLAFGQATTVSATLTLSGTGLTTGSNLPIDLLSLVTASELQQLSSRSASGSRAAADLAALGITSDLRSGGALADATLYFAVASHADWSSPNLVEFDIYIDTNGSGVAANGAGAEYLLFNLNLGSVTGNDPNDVFVTVLYNLATQQSTVEDFVNIVPASAADTVPFNSNVLVLPVTADSLRLSDTASRIYYRVWSFDLTDGRLVDTSDQLQYDLARPGISFGASPQFIIGPAYADVDGGTIPISYDRVNYAANRSRGVLLLHHHNGAGARVETVLINPQLFLPLLSRR